MTHQPPSIWPPSVVALMAEAVDYAGLFPPAALSMSAALDAYIDAKAGPDAWLLGRFVVPASRLVELVEHADARLERPLHLSVIVSDGARSELTAVAALPRALGGSLVVDAIECKPAGLDSIEWLADEAGGSCDVYVEVDPNADMDGWFSRLSTRKLRAKIRTGGTVSSAFPSPGAVAEFMSCAIKTAVPFKATAGLHHAVRGNYRLTYEPDSAVALMHGYLNLCLAAALLHSGHSTDVAQRLLAEADPSSLIIEPASIRWREFEWTAGDLRALRTNTFMGFGSCSIAEPADELRALSAARQA